MSMRLRLVRRVLITGSIAYILFLYWQGLLSPNSNFDLGDVQSHRAKRQQLLFAPVMALSWRTLRLQRATVLLLRRGTRVHSTRMDAMC